MTGSGRPHTFVTFLVAFAMVAAFVPAATADTGAASWHMENCHGVATLALAPLGRLNATLPAGYTALDAFTYQLIGSQKANANLTDSRNTHGLLGVELWKCDSITVGSVTVQDAVYASTAAVLNQPQGAPDASLYFYKYENFFSDDRLVQESERLGAPAGKIASATVGHTGDGAAGAFTLASGGTYKLTSTDAYGLTPGSFQEWHNGKKGVSNWAAAFTVAHGGQGEGTLKVPPGSLSATILGGTSGSGAGIHSLSTFDGSITLKSG